MFHGHFEKARLTAVSGSPELVEYMDDQCEVDKTSYNFCRQYRGLRGETPAMRQGLTDLRLVGG
jgi:hypothetical protein